MQYANVSYEKLQYSAIFWISGTTIQKLDQGFTKLLHLVGHADRDHREQSARLTAARLWLENAGIHWLLVLDNIAMEVVDFLREHVPRKNSRGHILFTTRTESVADALVRVAGKKHKVLELQAPNLEAAAELLLKEAGLLASQTSVIEVAKDAVKCVGCLPLAIAQASSFMKASHTGLNELLTLYRSNQKYEVSIIFSQVSRNLVDKLVR